ncbi:MAG: META domain-containing protein [Rikenellaceae bacterium]|nr:META domain-containing protein [Rikenellaceae bacterium]
MKKLIQIMCLALVFVAAVSCGGKKVRLTDGEWRLESMHADDETFVLMDKNPSITFSDTSNMVHGYGGCNNYFGNYEVRNGNKISISTLGSTLAMCPQIDTEDLFLHILSNATSYKISGSELILYDTLDKKIANFTLIRNK